MNNNNIDAILCTIITHMQLPFILIGTTKRYLYFGR